PSRRGDQNGGGRREQGEGGQRRRGQLMPAAMREQASGDEQRGQRDLHAGERAPDERSGERGERAGGERGGAVLRPGQRETPAEERRAQRRDDTERLREQRVAARPREEGAEQQGPQGRRRARQRHPGAVGA